MGDMGKVLSYIQDPKAILHECEHVLIKIARQVLWPVVLLHAEDFISQSCFGISPEMFLKVFSACAYDEMRGLYEFEFNLSRHTVPQKSQKAAYFMIRKSIRELKYQ